MDDPTCFDAFDKLRILRVIMHHSWPTKKGLHLEALFEAL